MTTLVRGIVGNRSSRDTLNCFLDLGSFEICSFSWIVLAPRLVSVSDQVFVISCRSLEGHLHQIQAWSLVAESTPACNKETNTL